MTTSDQKTQNSRASNRRLGLVLLTVAIAFFVGIVAKKIMFG
ncbi:MAG: hypothetical protein RIT33_175 [Pseudomonadota bacterium]|jgi:hypothetical protein|nr:cytochrome oxidase small assembly protein [Polynucleobacter cosmopolitanus]